jgi:hypothetical protein
VILLTVARDDPERPERHVPGAFAAYLEEHYRHVGRVEYANLYELREGH